MRNAYAFAYYKQCYLSVNFNYFEQFLLLFNSKLVFAVMKCFSFLIFWEQLFLFDAIKTETLVLDWHFGIDVMQLKFFNYFLLT